MQSKRQHSEQKPVIGITFGDYNGVGPEVILKALADNRILGLCTPVIYGSMKILSKYRKLLQLEDWFINQIKDIEQISHKKTNLIHCIEDTEIQVGQISPEAGKAAFASLEQATKDLLKGHLDGVVTAPINKQNIQNENFNFPGHTEYFTENFNCKDSLMMMVCDELRVAMLTGHIPLKEVPQALQKDRIERKIQLLVESLKKDFGINKPKIAVLGLNPHAGEEGLLGTEEQEIIEPILKEMRQKGMLIYGCFPADGFWGTQKYRQYDAVVACYHDQGLIPFKTLAFERGVNYTAGLPIVRTSPDHGTAYGIAGKNLADANSMREAIYLACDIIKTRKQLVVSAE
jgi:4-hydroxythreonine-4-phosphate dehydrogenase